MAELRQDPITREWVNVAPERGRRPSDFARATSDAPDESSNECPFCPGHEHASEATLYRFPVDEHMPWSVRVVPNKFPAFSGKGAPIRHKHGMYRSVPAVGAHEVVIETAQHNVKPADLSKKQLLLVLQAYRARYLAIRKDVRIRYVLIFGNHGAAAGASIRHAHSQIIGTPVLPQYARAKIEGVAAYEAKLGRCVYCDIVEQELDEGERIVNANASFISFAPYASRHAFETWIVPLRRNAHFVEADERELADLAAIFKDTLLRLDRALGDPPYNFVLLTTDVTQQFHWHIEIVPRLHVAAGFELGTRIFINSIAPETAAAELRQVDLSHSTAA